MGGYCRATRFNGGMMPLLKDAVVVFVMADTKNDYFVTAGIEYLLS